MMGYAMPRVQRESSGVGRVLLTFGTPIRLEEPGEDAASWETDTLSVIRGALFPRHFTVPDHLHFTDTGPFLYPNGDD
jgi:hypothetical protein